MTVTEINPYIRYCTIGHLNKQITVKTNDGRLFYCLSGHIKISVDGKRYNLTPGGLIVFQSGTAYSFEDCTGEFYILNFDYTCDYCSVTESMTPIPVTHWVERNRHSSVEFTDEPVLNGVLFLENAQFAESDLHEINTEFRRKEIGYQARISGIFKRIIVDILRARIKKSQKAISQEKLISYIRKNYTRDISNSEIGEALGYNPCYINRLLQECTGLTVRQYILECRLDKALRLLIYSEISVADIAESLGFSSASHFISFFKSRTGKTPLQYRAEVLT